MTQPPGTKNQSAGERQLRHDDQERLVRHLAEVMNQRLAGRDQAGTVIRDREPRERIALGVVPPRREPFVPDDHPELTGELGVPIDTLPPSEMGLTLLVEPVRDDPHVEIRCRFALYIRQFPTYEEQYAYSKGEGVDRPDTDRRSHANPRLRLVTRRYPVEVVVRLPVPTSGGYQVELEEAAITRVIGDTFAAAAANGCLYVPLSGRGQTIPQEILAAGPEAYETYLEAKAGDLEEIQQPRVQMLLSSEPTSEGLFRIDLTLSNVSDEAENIRGYKHELALYDAAFEAIFEGVRLHNSGFGFAEADYRVSPEVYVHGRFCVGEADPATNRVWTSTWPIYRQPVFESRQDLQPTFRDLAQDPVPTLRNVLAEMEGYASEWERFLSSGNHSAETRTASEAGRAEFLAEMERFRRGIDILDPRSDLHMPELARAFLLMNEAFEWLNTSTPSPITPRIESWYLFQIVFIVCGLAALAAREAGNGSPLIEEFDFVDVLWFPTGGGKSEAFLGLVATALFFDRLRGKGMGVTSIIRFPLRMLSVQQLDRVMNVIVACEHIRAEVLGEDAGNSFELGYFVGRQNTPNRLTDHDDQKWGDIRRMKAKAESDPAWRRTKTVITQCPYCHSQNVILDPDEETVRLHHICRACNRRLPVVISDDEIYRTLPSVVVATVDKLATIAFNAHFSHLTHGPRSSCPDHGYVTYSAGFKGSKRCLARSFCSVDPEEWMSVSDPYDPAPSIVVQDELHLLSEELGTFSSHYETLWAHLSSLPTGRPSKVVAATATISDYEQHVRHLYALRPRRFPAEGFENGRSFYARERPDLARRLFVGAMPGNLRPAQMAVAAAAACRDEVRRLQHLPPTKVISELQLRHYREADVADLLSRYDLQLFYVNRKTDGDRVGEDLERLGPAIGEEPLNVEVLNGQTALSDISAVIRRTQEEGSHTPPADRLAAVVGTSLISHGIDIGRVNLMHVAGMTSTIAYYVQATSRAGRSDVGLVLVGFSQSFTRDRAVFHFFDPHHRYVNHLVEPVSINRFSLQAPQKTLSGLLSALILHQIGRNPLCNPHGDANLTVLDNFRNCVQAHQQGFNHHNGYTLKEFLRSQVHVAYGLDSPVLDSVVRGRFKDFVDKQFDVEWTEIFPGRGRLITKSFSRPPMSSFRDIDDPVEFGAIGIYSRNRFEQLSGGLKPRDHPNLEVEPADESGEADGT